MGLNLSAHPVEVAGIGSRVPTIQTARTISQVTAAFDLPFTATGTLANSISQAIGYLQWYLH
jgi:hypothetical protein